MSDISVVMIVKNEADQIEDALSSFAPLQAELVVVDTGSQDATKLKASAAGAKVHDFAWIDDFSAARNHAISLAKGRYILIADADDRLPKSEAAKILKLVHEGTVKICALRVHDTHTGELFPSIRFWPKAAGIRYEGRVHEEPKFPDREFVPEDTLFTDIRLEHYGYSDELIRTKHERNIVLLKKELDERPGDPKLQYYLAKQYDAIKEPEKAIPLYEAVAADEHMHFNPSVCRNLVNILEQKGEYKRALKWLDKGIALFPEYADLHCLAGLVHYRMGSYADSIASYQAAIGLGESSGAFSHIKGTGSYIAWRGLGFSYLGQQDYENAMQSFSHAIAQDPTDELSERQIRNILSSVYSNSPAEVEEYVSQVRGSMA